jgi:hypothetical protein
MKSKNMKAIAGSVLFVLLAIGSFAQTAAKTSTTQGKTKAKLDKTKVPKVVTETYTIDYPGNNYDYWYGYPTFDYVNDWYDTDPYWYVGNYPESYVVEFTNNNTPYKAVYSKTGKKIAIHKSVNNLPAAVSAAINKSAYKTWTMGKDKEEIFKDKDSDQMKMYKVNVSRGAEKHVLYFEANGKLAKDKKIA